MSYAIGSAGMDQILAELGKKYRIFAPKQGKQYIRYGEVSSVGEIVWQEKSHFSPKEVFYPIVQTLLYFTDTECRESEIKDEREILLFLRACDINGIRRLDQMFLKNGGQADNFYKRMREKVKFVLMECAESFETCFCVSMGSNVAENYDLAVRFPREAGGELAVEVKDPALEPYFAGQKLCAFTPEFIRENKKQVQVPAISSRDLVPEIHALPFWKEFDEKCIGCGGCNTVCITCSCFDTADIVYREGSRDGERRRAWSSCMLTDFTTMAGGHSVRAASGDKMRFKTMHKVYDFQRRFGEENMCVGCGRCDMRCPKDIHFSETIHTLAQEVERLKAEQGSKEGGYANA